MERLGHFHRARSQAFACQKKVHNLYEFDMATYFTLSIVISVAKGQSQKDNMNLKPPLNVFF